MGVKFGFTEKEISRMYLGKWTDLFKVHQKYHNFVIKKGTYREEPQKVSLLSI